MLATVGVFDAGGGDGEWLIGTVVGMSLDVAMHYDTCEEVANDLGMDESAPSGPSGSSTLVGGVAPRATDGSFLPEVLCWETGTEVVGKVGCSLSKVPCIWRLRFLVLLGWGLMVEKRGGTGVVLIASGFVPQRSTSIMEGPLVASRAVVAFQSSSSLRSNTKASSPTFSPPGQTTCFPHYSNVHACNWWRRQQAFLWGLPSIRTPRCPSLDSGMCNTVSFIQMKAYGQSRPLSASKIRCQAASTRDTRHTWWACTQTAIRLKILLHPMARLGAIRRKAISFLGFSEFPKAPAWERVVSWVCLMVCTLNHWISGQSQVTPMWYWKWAPTMLYQCTGVRTHS